MRIEIKDIDPRDAAAFIQDILDELQLTESQMAKLIPIIWRHEIKAEIWYDSSGEWHVSPNY
jgi:hypothetical protein